MEENKSIDKRVLAGALLIVAGGLLFLETFDLIDFSLRHYIFSWKTLLIGIGIILLSTHERRTSGYILIALGVAFWLPSIVDYDVRFSQVFFPIMLIVIGLVILTRRGRTKDNFGINAKFNNNNPDSANTMDYLDDISILGGGNKRVQSLNFKGGRITAIFGGSEYNLKGSQVSPEGCVIDVFSMFGGSKLIVPEDWQVKSDVLSIFGGFTDKRTIPHTEMDTNKTLMIKGFVMFGGVEVKNY